MLPCLLLLLLLLRLEVGGRSDCLMFDVFFFSGGGLCWMDVCKCNPRLLEPARYQNLTIFLEKVCM